MAATRSFVPFTVGVAFVGVAALAVFLFETEGANAARAVATDVATSPTQTLPSYRVEWVYKVRWGYDDEFWALFRKTQIPVLDREKELGYITDYRVYRPGLHTSEDYRWNYRVVIIYQNVLGPTHSGEIEKQLFPDRAAYRRDENRRWELVDAHYDLPIREIDPHAEE